MEEMDWLNIQLQRIIAKMISRLNIGKKVKIPSFRTIFE